MAREVGTTVRLERLFYTLPVRLTELTKNIKREFARAISLLQAYAIVSTGVRLHVWSTNAKG